MVKQKKILIIAGPNGAGKTTFAIEFLPRGYWGDVHWHIGCQLIMIKL
jgi:predicted ABC-type ATPase